MGVQPVTSPPGAQRSPAPQTCVGPAQPWLHPPRARKANPNWVPVCHRAGKTLRELWVTQRHPVIHNTAPHLSSDEAIFLILPGDGFTAFTQTKGLVTNPAQRGLAPERGHRLPLARVRPRVPSSSPPRQGHPQALLPGRSFVAAGVTAVGFGLCWQDRALRTGLVSLRDPRLNPPLRTPAPAPQLPRAGGSGIGDRVLPQPRGIAHGGDGRPQSPGKPSSEGKPRCGAGSRGLTRSHPEPAAERPSLAIKAQDGAARSPAPIPNDPPCLSPRPVSSALRLAPVLPAAE